MFGNPGSRSIFGRSLVCPICGNRSFYERETLVSAAGDAFHGFDPAKTPVKTYICDRCGYMFWFHPVETRPERLSKPSEVFDRPDVNGNKI